MAPMNRMMCAVAFALIALAPRVAVAAPSLSPTLDKVLAAAPTPDYEESKTSADAPLGPLDSAQYAAGHAADPANAKQIQQALDNAGFIAGYERSWVNLGAGIVLNELVVAFNGANGAKALLAGNDQADKIDPTYVRALAISGIDPYYGAYFHDASSTLPYAYGFGFVKGNDYFVVDTSSDSDDQGRLVSTQTMLQYGVAPPYTIPPSQWSEAASNSSAVIGRILQIGVIALAFVGSLIWRSRRQRHVAAPTPAIGTSLQLSSDGRYWWDGHEWKDIQQWVPPDVQRSADGTLWWDGSRWRPVPPLHKLF
jgi:hypothetical protein